MKTYFYLIPTSFPPNILIKISSGGHQDEDRAPLIFLIIHLLKTNMRSDRLLGSFKPRNVQWYSRMLKRCYYQLGEYSKWGALWRIWTLQTHWHGKKISTSENLPLLGSRILLLRNIVHPDGLLSPSYAYSMPLFSLFLCSHALWPFALPGYLLRSP